MKQYRFLAILLVLALAMGITACNQQKEEEAASAASHSITLDQTQLTLAEDTTAALTATVQPESSVIWSSSDEAVVSVSGGMLLAKKPGNATVTASAGGASATCQVTVTASDGSFLYLEPSREVYPVEIGGEETSVAFTLYRVSAEGTKTEIPDAPITYTLENEKLARLEGNQLTGLISGVTKVVAVSDSYSAAAEVRVCQLFVSDTQEWNKMLASRTLGAYYMLDADIDFAGKTYTGMDTGAPASVKARSFRGNLDGNGHTVKNIRLGGGNASLFGQLYNAKIRNIRFENVELASGSGLATSISGQNTIVENISLELKFTQKSGNILLNTAFGGSLRNILVTVTTPGGNGGLDIIGTVYELEASGVYVLAEGALSPCDGVAAYTSKMELAAVVNSQKLLPAAYWHYTGGAELPELHQN